ncbi:MAG: hypothetical protein V1743_04105, partial [Nanoarchaeota archaeon]
MIQAEHRQRNKALGGKKTMDFGDIEPDIAKSKHAPLHTHIPAKDSDLAEEAMEEERKKEKA